MSIKQLQPHLNKKEAKRVYKTANSKFITENNETKIFETYLSKYHLPYELKYLPIVESALNPVAKSRAGAMGLWQFMPPTGKMMGLQINSFTDERCDPYLSTDAACKYLSRLFSIYKDWNLTLAAYNAGPGNVNKAIRRSGGKTTYWEIRSFLPKETQGYVRIL